MNSMAQEVLEYVEENDVKFIRLAFSDLFGNQKNISIMPRELSYALEHGKSFDGSAVEGFLNTEESDLLLFPDPTTLSFLPWRPSHGRVVRLYCDIMRPDGTHFEGDGRYILKKAVNRLKELGFICNVGIECEFYLFELDEKGNPTCIPHDHAGYCDIAPLDKGENVRREICLTLEQMDIQPESSHHEKGPGQNEIDFRYSDALSAADNLMTFETVVRTIAARNGLYASFDPKPLKDASGNGMHINLSLWRGEENIFKTGKEHSKEAESFIAGIMEHIQEITLFLNPTEESYQRFGEFEAPKYISWSHGNRSQLIRIPPAQPGHIRMELRSPDSTCNPYYALALLLWAGAEGIEGKYELCPPCNENLNHRDVEGLKMLPQSLEQAAKVAMNSPLVHKVLPEIVLKKFAEKHIQ